MKLRNIFKTKAVDNPIPIIDIPKVLEAFNTINTTKLLLKDDRYLASLDLQKAGAIMIILSGQQRSPLWEKWFTLKEGLELYKVPSEDDRGDLRKNNQYYELKTAVLDLEGKDKNLVFRGNQIRLWQKLDAYIFITTDKSTRTTKMYFIPVDTFKKHLRDGTISYSSSHIAGGSKNKSTEILDVNNRKEWGISMHKGKFNWEIYAVSEDQLAKKLNAIERT